METLKKADKSVKKSGNSVIYVNMLACHLHIVYNILELLSVFNISCSLSIGIFDVLFLILIKIYMMCFKHFFSNMVYL